MNDQFPIVERLPQGITSEDAFRRLVGKPSCVFFDSSLRDENLGRYSFVSCDPFAVYSPTDGQQLVVLLERALQSMKSTLRDDLPPFQGGMAGIFTYEFGKTFESVPAPQFDEFQLPAGSFGVYDVVVAFDHATDESWIVSQGFPELQADRRHERAMQRLAQFRDWLLASVREEPEWQPGQKQPPVDIQSPHHRCDRAPGVFSNFTDSGYLAAVTRAIDYIRAGDVFQVNLSQRLLTPASKHATEFYLRLRAKTPATFGGYFDAGSWQIASASPERFLQVRNRHVESRPIKGTRRQTKQPIADLFAAADLHGSGKDRAENVMIVDLMRNDLSRVCIAESIHVPQLCGLETYGYVQHLVSAVRGVLDDSAELADLLRATFPGGSITGAPKIRAMEIITELEQVARGSYCGSLGYINWNGDLDFSILIRTMTAAGGWWQMPVGGGVVVDSVPAAEYDETWHKAAGLLAALD